MFEDQDDNIKVVLRIRPLNQKESDENSDQLIVPSDEFPNK